MTHNVVYKRPPATGHIDKSDITEIYFCDLITCLSIGLIHAIHACGVVSGMYDVGTNMCAHQVHGWQKKTHWEEMTGILNYILSIEHSKIESHISLISFHGSDDACYAQIEMIFMELWSTRASLRKPYLKPTWHIVPTESCPSIIVYGN